MGKLQGVVAVCVGMVSLSGVGCAGAAFESAAHDAAPVEAGEDGSAGARARGGDAMVPPVRVLDSGASDSDDDAVSSVRDAGNEAAPPPCLTGTEGELCSFPFVACYYDPDGGCVPCCPAN